MRSLAILERLAKQAVDQERKKLQAIIAEITAVEEEIASLECRIEQEAASSLDIMTTGATLNAFIRSKKLRIHGLKAHMMTLEQARDMQIEQVRHERVEEKRFALLAERRARQIRLEEEERERKTIDELVSIKAGRRMSPER